jgi:hypothetical protein
MKNNSILTQDHASFGAHPLSTKRNRGLNTASREESSKCPTSEFSELQSRLRNYLPGDSTENDMSMKFSKFTDGSQQEHIMIKDNETTYLDFDNFDSSGTGEMRVTDREGSQLFTGRSSPEKMSHIHKI